jgi:hypothetical protein
MRRALPVLLLLLAGCATDTQDDPNAPKITLHLQEYESAPNAYTFNGAVNVKFALSVANMTNDAVNLNRIEIRTIGSGAYTIRPTSTPLNLDLGPGQARTVAIPLWGYSRGGQSASTEPVTVRGTAYFSGPKGAFIRLFSEYFTPQ